MKNESLTVEEIETARAQGHEWGEMEADAWSEQDGYDPSSVPDWSAGQWEGGFPARFEDADGGEALRDLYEREIDVAASAAWDAWHAAKGR